MAAKRTEHTGSFSAVDAGGHQHTLQVFTDILDAGTPNDPDAERPGAISIRTLDWAVVNRIAKGEYEVIPTGQRLHSDDPNAP
jgi:hypothetical protein